MLIKWIGPSPSFNSDSWIGEVSGAGPDEYFRVYKLKGSQTYRLRLSLGYVVKSWGFLAKHDAFAQAERIALALFGPTVQEEFMAAGEGAVDVCAMEDIEKHG